MKNVDEPGRTPYKQQMFFFQNASHCDTNQCTIAFPPVPAGVRLVVTYFCIGTRVLSPQAYVYGSLIDVDQYQNHVPTLNMPAVAIGGNYYLASGPVTFFYEPGSTPIVMMSGSVMDSLSNVGANASIIGYLVALP